MATDRHPKAASFVRQGLFAKVKSFTELETRIASLPDEQSRGDAFEVFAEAYLATQRKHDAAKVWPLTSVPTQILRTLGLATKDYGIDGVFQTLLGNFSAYQVKFRTNRPALTWRELSTFMGLADSPHIRSRLLLTNCDDLPSVLNERQGFFCIRGSDLDRLEADDFRAIEAWLADTTFVPPRKQPQSHQVEALAALLPALESHDRVSAIMACGTGKTLVALWVAEHVAQSFHARTGGTGDPPVPSGDSPLGTEKRGKHAGDVAYPTRPAVSSGQWPDETGRWPVPPGKYEMIRLGQASSPAGSGDVPTARILVLVPSLALLRQILHEWLRETSLPNLAYLCVCSDPTVKDGLDAIATPQSDLDFQVSTDAASVREFLDATFAGTKIVFSTYQSAQVVGAALQPGESFDLAVFDEAHKTAGRGGRNYAFALEDTNLSIRKRLFLTATPRHYNPLRKDKEGDAQLVFSMDRPEVYGPQAFRLTFAEAARRKIICGYKVIISVITSEMVTNELLSHGEVMVNGDPVRARQVANQIALRDAIEKYGVKKVFTFHSTVKSAASFVADGSEGIGTHLARVGDDVRRLTSKRSQPSSLNSQPISDSQSLVTSSPTNGFQTFHVNGTMPTARREREMRDFRSAARAVMSNARCLTEGVDVSTVDMVAFLSPRRSRVDIVQATGRAMRVSPGKTTGYMLVPLYLEQAAGETVEEAVGRAEFDEVWDVLQSLQEQDDVLAEIVREMREDRGRTRGFDDSRLRQRVEVIGPEIYLELLRSVVATECITHLAEPWDESFGQLKAFKERFGHCNVVRGWAENPRLSTWVTTQRHRADLLRSDRVARLNEIGFIWDPIATYWEQMFEELASFKNECGHCNVPAKWSENPPLATWIDAQRQQKKKNKLALVRMARLEALGLVWDPYAASWEEQFQELMKFKIDYGHCHVPARWQTGPELSAWVNKQRTSMKKGSLSQERICRLEGIGFVWDVFDSGWEEMFAALQEYKQRFGHCGVPDKWSERSGLGSWVGLQRRLRQKKKLNHERINRLDELGFIWDPASAFWNEMFETVRAFGVTHGHCNVPGNWPKNPQLATWVLTQRQQRKKGKLDTQRSERLEEIGFSWDPEGSRWNTMFSALLAFQQRNGHCNVPVYYSENPKLGSWIRVLRRSKRDGKLDTSQIRQLDAIGFRWEDPNAAAWNKNFSELFGFWKKNGHSNVPQKFAENPTLGRWANWQRFLSRKGRLSKERIRTLDEIGFVWNLSDALWEEMFHALLQYKQRFGHCNVPAEWKQNPQLGAWAAKHRMLWKQGRLEPERQKRLEVAGLTTQLS